MRLNEYLYYKGGALFNLVNRGTRAKRGSAVKTTLNPQNGYLSFTLSGKTCYVHKAVWELHNGSVPAGLQIDHIDRDKTNNLIENLRAVTPRENLMNRDYGIGVRSHRNKWQSYTHYCGKFIHIGIFNTKEEALLNREEFLELLGDIQ